MNPFDSAATAEVWRRVNGAREEQTAAELLLEMISDEMTDSATYLRLARCGIGARVFRALAQEEDCHARRLKALYFLLTGQEACTEVGAVPYYSCVADALRDRFAEEQRSAKRYLAAAERLPEHCGLFRELAAQEQEHARRLHRLTQCVL